MSFFNRKRPLTYIPDESVSDEDFKSDDEGRIVGKIIYLNPDEGWGFITSQEKKFIKFFFHWMALEQGTLLFPELRKDMEVEFKPMDFGEKGWRAIKIEVIKSDEKESK